MIFTIQITQTLDGHVDIEANSVEEALETAERIYVAEGHELPDMNDGNDLGFMAVAYRRGD